MENEQILIISPCSGAESQVEWEFFLGMCFCTVMIVFERNSLVCAPLLLESWFLLYSSLLLQVLQELPGLEGWLGTLDEGEGLGT